MSRNLYLGGDLNPVVAAVQTGDPMSIATAVGELWRDVHTRDFTARAEALAEEIAQQQPVFIGLQEVSQFIAGNVYHPLPGGGRIEVPGTAETIDYLDILLNELDEQGLPYTTVATTDEFAGPFTALLDAATFAFQVIQFTDRDAILARSDLPAPAVVMTGSTVERVAIFCSVAAVMTGCLVAQAAISSTVDGETTHLPVAKAMTGCSEAWATNCWTAAADSTGCLAASDSTSC